MARHHEDWLTAFVEYAGYGEAPKHVYWWVGVAAIAGALRRKCYIDQYYFRWFSNFYIILVAPPGVISKSTTASIGMDLLKRVPGVVFGPNVVTWQALVHCLAKANEPVETSPGHYEDQASLTISSSELGNLLNPQDRDMVDLLVTTWSGEDLHKVTKQSGSDEVPRPLLNIIACTTPAWISENIPEYMLGGGLLSRCIFVFADRKERLVAYPGLAVPKDIGAVAELLIEDLTQIAGMHGEFAMTTTAIEWGEEWYKGLFKHLNGDQRLRDYIARKQTHLHKLAMILSASRREDMYITEKELVDANHALDVVEARMGEVFTQVGRTPESTASDQAVAFIRAKGSCSAVDVYAALHSRFPKESDLDNIIRGLLKSGKIKHKMQGDEMILRVNEGKK